MSPTHGSRQPGSDSIPFSERRGCISYGKHTTYDLPILHFVLHFRRVERDAAFKSSHIEIAKMINLIKVTFNVILSRCGDFKNIYMQYLNFLFSYRDFIIEAPN